MLHVLEAEKDIRHVLCATRPCKVCDVCLRLEVTLYALEMLEGMRGVLVCMLEVVDDVEGGLCFAGGAGGDARCAALYTGRSGVPELMRCVLLCMSETVDSELCSLDALEVLEVLDGMRRMPLCILEAVEGELCLLEVLDVLEVMRFCYSVCWRPWNVGSVCWRFWRYWRVCVAYCSVC